MSVARMTVCYCSCMYILLQGHHAAQLDFHLKRLVGHPPINPYNQSCIMTWPAAFHRLSLPLHSEFLSLILSILIISLSLSGSLWVSMVLSLYSPSLPLCYSSHTSHISLISEPLSLSQGDLFSLSLCHCSLLDSFLDSFPLFFDCISSVTLT